MKGVDMFNFQSVMGDYYGYNPKDDAGKASKRTFQANMVQSAFDTQLAMTQAEQDQQYDLDTRLATANLELSNQKELMKDTFSYGTQKMAMEYDLQSRFAVDDAARDLNKMAAAGGIQKTQTRLEGTENRLTLDQQGRQEVEQIGATGVEQRKGIAAQGTADISKIGAQGSVDLDKIGATGTEQRKGIQAQGDVDINKIGASGTEDRKSISAQGSVDIGKIGAQGDVDLSKIGATGTEQRKGIQTQGDVDISKIGAQGDVDISKIGAAGDQERSTLQEKTRLQAKDRTNQYQFANQLAAR